MEIIALAALAALLLWGVLIYNRLVRDRNRVRAAWSDIDVQLKRRHDLIPKLVEAVRQYAAYEKSTLEGVTALRDRSRATGDVAEKGPLEAALGARLRRLIALAEAYPDLKASRSFLDLQHNLTEVENHAQYARRYYNGAVREYNTRIDQFPDTLLARAFAFRPGAYFELGDDGEREPPELG